MESAILETTVGQLVAERPGRSRTFERLGIDYCCGGKKSLARACSESKLDPENVVQELAAEEQIPLDERDWLTAPISDLCDHIQSTHHAYLKRELPRLADLAYKVANAHGGSDPRLGELVDVLGAFRLDLQSHMGKEEMVLFPLIRQLDGAIEAPRSHCGSVNNPIRVMMLEHGDAGTALEQMRRLTDGFTPPATACNTYRALLDGLHELELDMHLHVHKENSILFPRAIEAEEGTKAHKTASRA